MLWEQIQEFFKEGSIANYILDGYLIFVLVFFVLWFALRSKHFYALLLPIVLVLLFGFLAKQFSLGISNQVYSYLYFVLPIFFVVVMAPDIHKWLETSGSKDQTVQNVKGTNANKQAIADAVMFLSSRKIGALITIEKHKLLDQYAEKAIIMNAEISKELLINIFSPLTPLHDGAVIIKGNKIRCAGAYYVLSTRDNLDKTVGSRHRAALGIAEVTDSITIVVSEETGKISITYSGIIISISDREKLLEYKGIAPLIEKIEKSLSNGRTIIAIDGGSASGKTTLASLLSRVYDGTVFHMDDFFLPPHLRTPERLNEVGGNVDRDRFENEVLIPLSQEKTVNYRPFDCKTGDFKETTRIEPKKLVIIEGAYSMHPSLRGYYTTSLFLEIDKDTQKDRVLKRNIDTWRVFFEKWIPLEDEYFEKMDIKSKCDFIIKI